MDSREISHQWWLEFDERRMTLSFIDPDRFDAEEMEEATLEVPAVYAVCPLCEGRGSHVNPSIDSQGLTQEDFEEAGPEFKEDYVAGVFDQPCVQCKGRRVVPVVSRQTPAELQVKAARVHRRLTRPRSRTGRRGGGYEMGVAIVDRNGETYLVRAVVHPAEREYDCFVLPLALRDVGTWLWRLQLVEAMGKLGVVEMVWVDGGEWRKANYDGDALDADEETPPPNWEDGEDEVGSRIVARVDWCHMVVDARGLYWEAGTTTPTRCCGPRMSGQQSGVGCEPCLKEATMRSSWKGHWKIGLVMIPIRLYKSSETKRTKAGVSFNGIHDTCKARVHQRTSCSACQIEVSDPVRGFEVTKGKFLIVSDEELDALKTSATKILDVKAFAPADDLPATLIEDTEYMAPASRGEASLRRAPRRHDCPGRGGDRHGRHQ